MAQSLTKFPVTTADGTEYRVSIMKDSEGDLIVSVYTEIKRSMFGRQRFELRTCLCVFAKEFRGYVDAVKFVVDRYHAEACKRSEAVRRFNEWDGKICDS